MASPELLDQRTDKILQNLKVELKGAHKDLEAKTLYVKGVQRNYEALANFCTKLRQEELRLQQQLSQAQSRIKELEAQRVAVSKASDTQKAATSENATLKATLEEKEKELSATHTRLQVCENRLTVAMESTRALSAEVARLEGTRQQEISELQQKIKGDDSRQRLAMTERRLEEAQRQVAQTEAQLKALAEEVTALRIAKQKAENKLARAELDRENMRVDMNTLRTAQREMQEKHREQKAIIDRQVEQLSLCKFELQTLESRGKDARLQTAQLSDAKKDLEERVKLLTSQQSTLQERVQALETEKASNEQRVASVTALEKSEKDTKAALAEANAKLSAANDQITKLQAEAQHIPQLTSEIDSLKAQLQQSEKDRGVVAAGQSSISAELEKLKARIQELDGELDAQKKLTEKSEAARCAAFEELSIKIGSLQDQLKQANEKLNVKKDPAVEQRQAELRRTIAKLIHSEEAAEGIFTCMSCMKLFNNPVTCIPCGHSYCRACVQDTKQCKTCGPCTIYANSLLGELTAKYIYRKQALGALKLLEGVDLKDVLDDK